MDVRTEALRTSGMPQAGMKCSPLAMATMDPTSLWEPFLCLKLRTATAITNVQLSHLDMDVRSGNHLIKDISNFIKDRNYSY